MSTALVESVVARSKIVDGREDAWVALKVRKTHGEEFVVAAHFKHKDLGAEAFSRASKYAKNLAEDLGVAYVKRRAAVANVPDVSKRAGPPTQPGYRLEW